MKKKKFFITLGYQNSTYYFLEFVKLLSHKYDFTCLVYGYKNYLKVLENKKLFENIYSYEQLIGEFEKDNSIIEIEKLVPQEKKYGLFWKYLYADRQFLDYFYDIDYGDTKCSYNDLIKLTKLWANFFEKIFSSYDYKYIVSYSTASFPAVLSVKIAEYYKVKYICFKTIGIPDRFTIIDELKDKFLVPLNKIEDYKWAENFYNDFKENSRPNWIKKRTKPSLFKRVNYAIQAIIAEKKVFNFIDNNKTVYLNYTLFKLTKLKIFNLIKRLNYNHFLRKKNSIIEGKFIFFPLHVEPESNLMIKNVLNTDQINFLENISKHCPIDMKIVVKDHPNQPIRNATFYERVNKIPNIIFVDSSINSKKLIKESYAVLSIAGSTIIETLLIGKKLLVFGNSIIIENFFPELKCNYSNFEEKLKENIVPPKEKVIRMISYLKNISVDIDSSILIEKGNSKLVGEKFFELFKRIDD